MTSLNSTAMNDWSAPTTPIRTSWNTTRMLRRGFLTDKKIDYYAKRGWYDEAFREARRELWERKAAKRERRDGNFVIRDGRMVFSPL